MKFITRIKEKLVKRKKIKSRIQMFDEALAMHAENYTEKLEERAINLGLFGLLNEYSLSLNFGRMFGHSTYVKHRLKNDPNTVFVFEGTRGVYANLGQTFIKDLQKKKRAFSVGSNTRGIDFNFEEGKLVTILVDRGYFHKSNKNIIESLIENHSGIFRKNQFRLVILG